MLTRNLGYPRIGKKRELKRALEAFWRGEISPVQLKVTGRTIRNENWQEQLDHKIDLIPVNDFSFYDHVLDMCVLLGAIPARFKDTGHGIGFDRYFVMARGFQSDNGDFVPPMEMTKWFNTNYHYIVPELSRSTNFELNTAKLVTEISELKEMGGNPVPVILGPLTFLMLSKSIEEDFHPLGKLDDLLPIYQELFLKIGEMGIEFIQLDEPILTTDLTISERNAFTRFFEFFQGSAEGPKIILTTYFGDISENADLLEISPFEGLHIDFLNASNLDEVTQIAKNHNYLSMGLVDGRNIWKIDLQRSLEKVRHFQEIAPNSKLIISPSCSLLHVPLDAELETDIDPELKSWLAFAEQKLEEIKTIGKYFDSPELVDEVIKENQDVLQSRESARKSSQDDETESEDIGQFFRTSSYSERVIKQRKALHLPDLPTTTIGSFPQTKEVRRMRFKFNRGEISRNDYEDFIKKETENTIRMQESLGLDVLVHGEFERNDMVQYFAEKLDGFSFTQNGWVQSYGSRCVRPPIIYKKVGRPKPMTVRWIQFAQSLTDKPMKGMLTGPVTILQWSFVRDDQPLETTCREIAFAIREEVLDLEAAGIRIIQIDEPAFREGMPVNQKDHANYLRWAVECFRIASGGVKDETQIHTHMCYSEFNQIIESIAAMDADVISIEASRSKMELLDAFNLFKYPNEIGPGVYDIHSPGVPISEDIAGLIRKALKVIPVEKIWVNPDCGLKTRRWEEALPSLKAMVSGARIVRSEISG